MQRRSLRSDLFPFIIRSFPFMIAIFGVQLILDFESRQHAEGM